MGRVNYGSYINDQKGIIGGLFASDKLISGCVSYPFPLNNTDELVPAEVFTPIDKKASVPKTAVFFESSFDAGKVPKDTFLSLNSWSKGVVFVNNFNLGRYWPVKGPQKTLYVPANILKPSPATNEILVFEIDSAPCQPPDYADCFVEFVDTPDLG